MKKYILSMVLFLSGFQLVSASASNSAVMPSAPSPSGFQLLGISDPRSKETRPTKILFYAFASAGIIDSVANLGVAASEKIITKIEQAYKIPPSESILSSARYKDYLRWSNVMGASVSLAILVNAINNGERVSKINVGLAAWPVINILGVLARSAKKNRNKNNNNVSTVLVVYDDLKR